MTTEAPCPPVEAFRWFVTFGTCWAEVVAASKQDAVVLGMARAGMTDARDVKVRRLCPSDEGRLDSWKAIAQQMGLSDRESGIG